MEAAVNKIVLQLRNQKELGNIGKYTQSAVHYYNGFRRFAFYICDYFSF